ncbi:MAG: DUF4381 domain-containing protein [Syntrophotaleaceae bacterium]
MLAPSVIDPQTLPLRDIHLPDPVSWWPPAPGWWLLTILALALTAGSGWLYVRYRRGRYRRLALAELDRLDTLPDAELAAGLSQLLRRAALCHFNRADCAGLNGEKWLEFLDRPFADRPFTEGIGRCLLEAPYRPDVQFDRKELADLCRRWLTSLPPAGGSGRIP